MIQDDISTFFFNFFYYVFDVDNTFCFDTRTNRIFYFLIKNFVIAKLLNLNKFFIEKIRNFSLIIFFVLFLLFLLWKTIIWINLF